MFKLLVVLSFAFTSSAFAMPLAPMAYDSVWPSEGGGGESSKYNFEGIVALSNCSGSIIKFTHSIDSDNAMVLTNGHCLEGGMPKPGVVHFNKPVSRNMAILNPKDGTKIGTIHATKILYSTMTKTDVTIYVLQETFQEIAASFQIQPLTLSDKKASVGEGMEIISGYWKRGYSCNIEAFVPTLKEADWTMNDSIRYSRPGCETIGGTSGSPIISTQTKEVIGINNTGNEDGQKCTMNNPCEVNERGEVTYEKGVSYGQQTYWFYTCMNEAKQLDLNVSGCLLAK